MIALRAPMQRMLYGGYSPRVDVEVTINGKTTQPIRSLVDTGATYTLLHYQVGKVLGLSIEDMESGQTHTFSGASSTVNQCHACYAARADLTLFAKGSVGRLVMSSAQVFFTNQYLCGNLIVLGQRDTLERLSLTHRNHNPRPEFVLIDWQMQSRHRGRRASGQPVRSGL